MNMRKSKSIETEDKEEGILLIIIISWLMMRVSKDGSAKYLEDDERFSYSARFQEEKWFHSVPVFVLVEIPDMAFAKLC